MPVSEGLAPGSRHRIIGPASPIHRWRGTWRHTFIGGGVTVSSGELGHFHRVLRSFDDDEGVTLSSVNMAADRGKWHGGVRLQDERDRLRPDVARPPRSVGTSLAAPDALRSALLRLEVVVAYTERVPALGAGGLLRGSIDPNESVAVQRVLPSVSLSSTAREGPAKEDEPSRARSADREPLTAGAPA